MKKILFLFVLLTAHALNSSATIYYVTPSGNDNSSGLSWATARRTINSALDSAVIGDSIFIAVGEYAGFYPRNGVHIFAKGNIPKNLNNQDELFEMYKSNRS